MSRNLLDLSGRLVHTRKRVVVVSGLLSPNGDRAIVLHSGDDGDRLHRWPMPLFGYGGEEIPVVNVLTYPGQVGRILPAVTAAGFDVDPQRRRFVPWRGPID